jgi:putative ABC transport system ATP-binding protein
MSTAVTTATALRAPAIALAHVARTYPGDVRALDDVSLTVEHGTFLAVMGPSGSGKSTLMHCAAGLDSPTSGSVRIDGQEISGMNETRRTELRRERVGFVFQAYNLIPSLSVEDNITLPLRLAGRRPDRDWLRTLTERVGLAGRLAHRPAELSGGQQQRAAVVRALAAKRWRPSPPSSSRTSRPGRWTCAAPTRCWTCCAASSTTWARRW